MGIQGLIPLLEKSWKSVNVSEFSGCTVAVDAYCWLHKGVYTCAEKLARGEDCQAYVYYCMRFVSMLLANNIKPILVFDGQNLPAKADTESKRRKLREQNRKKAAELLRLDKGKEASSLLRRSIDVTHRMALNLINKCREINVDCIVAPYEADSQLAYLNLSGIADIVITEDSDLLLFGCKRVLFKMDQNGGGLLIEQEKLYLSMNMLPEQFNFEKFRHMCILSGCDYLPSIPGIGLIKARQFITRISEPDIYKSLMRLGSFMNVKVPSEYRDQFMDADRMFLYQPVYDPLSRKLIPLNKLPDPNLPPVLVSKLNSDQIYQLALGNVDPISLEVMSDWDPNIDLSPNKMSKSKIIKARHKSIWLKDYQSSHCEPDIFCALTPKESVKSPPTLQPTVTKNITQTTPKIEPSTIEKKTPVTENDILSTLEEIYENEKVSKNKTITNEKHQLKKSITNKNNEIIEKVLSPEIDEITAKNEAPIVFTQLTKRKYNTIINSEKQVVSGYFSTQISKVSDIVEEKSLNPFKCRKITISKEKPSEDTTENLYSSYSSFDSSNIVRNKKLQCLENEKITETYTNTLNKTQASFSWKSYSSSKTITSSELKDEKKYQITVPQNDSILLNDNDDIKIDNDNDIDEGFCSQNAKEPNYSTPKPSKRSYPRTGLSKSAGKSGQTLLSKFGFKTSGQMKH